MVEYRRGAESLENNQLLKLAADECTRRRELFLECVEGSMSDQTIECSSVLRWTRAFENSLWIMRVVLHTNRSTRMYHLLAAAEDLPVAVTEANVVYAEMRTSAAVAEVDSTRVRPIQMGDFLRTCVTRRLLAVSGGEIAVLVTATRQPGVAS